MLTTGRYCRLEAFKTVSAIENKKKIISEITY